MAVDLSRISKLHAALVGTTGTLAYATHVGAPGSVVLGGALMGVNFWLLRVIVGAACRGAAESGGRGRAVLALGAVLLKFTLFLGVLAALFLRLPVDGMSFACGVTLLLVACVLEAAGTDWARRKGEV
jgi:hypothetical protein